MLKGKRLLGLSAVLLAAFCLGMFGASLLHPQASLESEPSPVQPLKAPVASDNKPDDAAPDTGSPSVPEAPSSPPTVPDGLLVPSLGLNVPLEAIDVQDGQITPPTFDTAYVVNGYSAPLEEAQTGSVYVVFHSQRDGGGIGNLFFNQQTGEPVIGAGETITLNGRTFTTVETLAVPKDELPYRDDIWGKAPGMLYLITCLQNPEGTPSTHNFIVVAKLASET